MRLHDKVFYASVCFIAGIAFASFGVNIWIIGMGLAVGVLINFLQKKGLPVVLLGSAIVLGSFYYHFFSAYRVISLPMGDSVAFQGVVVNNPSSSIKNQEVYVSVRAPYKGELLVYAPPYPEFRYGDLLEVKGRVVKSEFAKAGAIVFPKSIKLTSTDQGSVFKSALFAIKNSFIAKLREVLPMDKAALASGILLGDRTEFTDEFKEAMKMSGTTHIVALSGYNISIIAVLVSALLSSFLSRSKSFYISIFVIVAFVLMTGAEASVVRAAIMGIIALVAERSSRLHSMRNAITLTATAMLVSNPMLLVFDAGFQLSFLALLGLIYLEPITRRFLRVQHNPKWESGWRKNLTQTISAQVAVLPVVIPTFGYFSPLSIVANVLIAGLIPATMLLAFLTAVSGFVFYPLSLVIGWLASIFLGYEIFIINAFSFNWF